MNTAVIKMSQLDVLPIQTSDDFIAIDASASLTTYRSSVQTLGNWMAASGSASYSQNSLSSSVALLSNYTLASSNSLYSNSSSYTAVAKYVNVSPVNFVSYSLSSSFASSSISCSYAITTSHVNVVQPTFITYAISSSWASQSLSASYASTSLHAITASHAETATSVGFSVPLIKAYAMINGTLGNNGNNFTSPTLDVNSSYNIASVQFIDTTNARRRKDCISDPRVEPVNYRYGVTFSTPMPDTTYQIMGVISSYLLSDSYTSPPSKDYFHSAVITMDKLPDSIAAKSVNSCTMSMMFLLPVEGFELYTPNYNNVRSANNLIVPSYSASFCVF